MPPLTIPQASDLAYTLQQAGRLAEAEQLCGQILAVEPHHAHALHLLGLIGGQTNRRDFAVEMMQKAIELQPDAAEFHCNLGSVLSDQGRLEAAVASFRRSLALNPVSADALNNLGNALRLQGQREAAVAAYRQAIAFFPEEAEIHNNLGVALFDGGETDAAIASFRRALDLRAGFPLAWNNLGLAFGERGQFDDAVAAYRQAIQLQPAYAEAHNNLSVALRDRGEIEAAVAACRRALELQPSFAEAHNNLGNALKNEGQIHAAIAEFHHALRCRPDLARAHSNLLLTLHYADDLEPGAIFAEHTRWEARHAAAFEESLPQHANLPDPGRRLRVGYVSPDFRDHPVASFFENILASHDCERLEVFCYDDGRASDEVTTRLQRHAAGWRRIRGLPDAAVAELIRSDRIDLLVDLAGHTLGHRLLVFARRSAPVQVSYLGYCDTTGLKAIDYRLTDALADPPGLTEHLHSEQLVRLPASAWCFRPPSDAPAVSAPPAHRTGHLTFGCFNAIPKITDSTLALWSRILRDVPGSRLLLKQLGFRASGAQKRIRAVLEDAGIAPERIEQIGPVPGSAEHLGTYARVDLALDTFPYHGTKTTCEALWMGVPVITRAGQTHASRVGVSLLTNAGVPELIATGPDDYHRLAVQLATDLPRLAALRTSLRERMARSPILDGERSARDLEAAFREMWSAWCERRRSGSPAP